MNIEEYKEYAKERRLKSKIACCLDKCEREDISKHGYLTQLINGNITSDSFNNPYMYECTIGDRYESEEKKICYIKYVSHLFLFRSKGLYNL